MSYLTKVSIAEAIRKRREENSQTKELSCGGCDFLRVKQNQDKEGYSMHLECFLGVRSFKTDGSHAQYCEQYKK